MLVAGCARNLIGDYIASTITCSTPSHFPASTTQMWLLLLPVVLLSGVVCAQGADTIELSDMFLTLAQNELEFSFAFNGNSDHHT
jgi:hypothetical protein